MKRNRTPDTDEDSYDEQDFQKDGCPSQSYHISDRKKRRGVIEKRRRDRINNSLCELRRLVPAAFEKQGSAKLEKAEILQMTVDHLKLLHSKGLGGYSVVDSGSSSLALDYRLSGLRECSAEVARYLVTVEGFDLHDPLRLRLISHLQCYCAQATTSTSIPLTANPTTAPPPWTPHALQRPPNLGVGGQHHPHHPSTVAPQQRSTSVHDHGGPFAPAAAPDHSRLLQGGGQHLLIDGAAQGMVGHGQGRLAVGPPGPGPGAVAPSTAGSGGSMLPGFFGMNSMTMGLSPNGLQYHHPHHHHLHHPHPHHHHHPHQQQQQQPSMSGSPVSSSSPSSSSSGLKPYRPWGAELVY